MNFVPLEVSVEIEPTCVYGYVAIVKSFMIVIRERIKCDLIHLLNVYRVWFVRLHLHAG